LELSVEGITYPYNLTRATVYVLTLTDGTRSLFGFLSGSLVAGGVVYYYILGEYRVSNNMLTEDIYVCITSSQASL
jgi:hypothetical protein